MNRGQGLAARVRAAWLAACIVPLALLVTVPTETWHEEHGDDECVVCHAARQTADSPRPAEPVAASLQESIGPGSEVRRVPSRRPVRQPARAPPA